MIRIQTRESEKGKVQAGWGTKVFHSSGVEIKEITRIKVDIRADTILTAALEIALMDFSIEAEEHFKLYHPMTGELKEIKSIQFADGTEFNVEE
jgi:UV DNA damage repair endonuclease